MSQGLVHDFLFDILSHFPSDSNWYCEYGGHPYVDDFII